MKLNPGTVLIPPQYQAFVFRAFNVDAGVGQPYEIIKVVCAIDLQHAHEEIKRFERDQGFDFTFRYLGSDSSLMVVRSSYYIESLF